MKNVPINLNTRSPSPTPSDSSSCLSNTAAPPVTTTPEDQERVADANMRNWLKRVLFSVCLVSLPTSGYLIYDDIRNHNKDETELNSAVALLGAMVFLAALIGGGLASYQRRLERDRFFSSPSASPLLPGGDLELGNIKEESSSSSVSLSPRSPRSTASSN